jgi:hypothetical protein
MKLKVKSLLSVITSTNGIFHNLSNNGTLEHMEYLEKYLKIAYYCLQYKAYFVFISSYLLIPILIHMLGKLLCSLVTKVTNILDLIVIFILT